MQNKQTTNMEMEAEKRERHDKAQQHKHTHIHTHRYTRIHAQQLSCVEGNELIDSFEIQYTNTKPRRKHENQYEKHN